MDKFSVDDKRIKDERGGVSDGESKKDEDPGMLFCDKEGAM